MLFVISTWHCNTVKQQQYWKLHHPNKQFPKMSNVVIIQEHIWRNIFCHLCHKPYSLLLFKTCIHVIMIEKLLSENSVYMHVLHMWVFTRNKVKRQLKHLYVTYFCISHISAEQIETWCHIVLLSCTILLSWWGGWHGG